MMNVSTMVTEEWKSLLQDKRLLAILLLVPVVCAILFGSIYYHGKIRSVPTVYIDEDATQLSQQIVQAFDASESFEIVGAAASEAELMQDVQEGKAYVGLIIPSGLSEKIKQGSQAEFMTVIDGSNMTVVSSVLKSANEIAQTYSAGISMKRLEANGVPADYVSSVGMGYRMLFNPGGSFGIYLPLGYMGAINQQVILLGMALCVAREMERKRWEEFLIHWKAPWKVFFAKALPYFIIGNVVIYMTLGILTNVFHVPFMGQLGPLFTLIALFVFCLMTIGFLLSISAHNTIDASKKTFQVTGPSFIVAGYVWPFMAMPGIFSYIGHLLPLTYFLHGLTEVMIKGNGWEQIWGDLRALLIISFCVCTAGMLRLTLQGKKHLKQKEGALES
jgi:ABC-2 type transport system permease protein